MSSSPKATPAAYAKPEREEHYDYRPKLINPGGGDFDLATSEDRNLGR